MLGYHSSSCWAPLSFYLARQSCKLLVLAAWGYEEERPHWSAAWQHGLVMYSNSMRTDVLDQEIIGTSKLTKRAICRLHLEVFLRLDMYKAVAVIN